MELLYWIAIKLYGLGMRLAAAFHPKAKEWQAGRAGWASSMRRRLNHPEKRIWIHCSSLGEFEQGKPLIERLKTEYPNHKLVVTFFSPSGFNQKKNDSTLDYVFYLPLDGRKNSRLFIEMVNPSLVFFVKYEFWYFYLKCLRERKIPSFVISASFHPGLIYFKWYGTFFFKMLQQVTHIFVQNQESLQLLYDHAITKVTVSGDTRFDRVITIRSRVKDLPLIKSFKGDKMLFVAGSTWAADEKLILDVLKEDRADYKIIIAPHVVTETVVNRIIRSIGTSAVRYSDTNPSEALAARVMVIDNIGLLSSIYAYSDIAYVGGGFGVGIHNTLEAAVFGVPVLFGPNHQAFKEAVDMVKLRTAFPVENAEEFKSTFFNLLDAPDKRALIREKNLSYVESNKGATDVVINYLKFNFQI